jgi:hypothetical protein
MPFGLTNAPSFFQFFINDIFRDYLDRFVVSYLDDLLIYSDSEHEHIEHVKLVLQLIADHGLAVKLEKCAFHTNEAEFLGFIISPNGCKMDETKVQRITDWKAPQNVLEVQTTFSWLD